MTNREFLINIGIDVEKFEAMTLEQQKECLLEHGFEVVTKDEVEDENEWNELFSFDELLKEASNMVNEKMNVEKIKKDWKKSARKCRVSFLAARIGAAILTGGTSEIAYQLVVEPKLKEVLPTEFLW